MLSILNYGGVILPSKGVWAMYEKLESKRKAGYLTFKYDMDVEGLVPGETNCWCKFSMGIYTEVTPEDYRSFIKGLDFIRPHVALNRVSFELEVDETVNKEAGYRDSVFDLRVVDRTLGNQLTGQLADYFVAFGEKCPLVKPSLITERHGPLPLYLIFSVSFLVFMTSIKIQK